MNELMQQHPVFTMIKKMTATNQSDRLNINDLVQTIDNARSSGIPVQDSDTFNAIENHIDDDIFDMNASEQLKDYLENLDHLS